MTCDCDCHKQDSISKLKRCKERNKTKEKKIKELEKKVLTLTLICAIIGTIVGKEVVEEVVDWYNTFDKVKSTLTTSSPRIVDYTIDRSVVYGSSPEPGTLAIVGLIALTPTRRRR